MSEQDAQRRKLVSLIAGRALVAPRRRALASLAGKSDDTRVTIRETDDGLGIRNPSQHFMPVVIFLLLWLGGWAVGEFFVLNEIFSSSDPFADLFLVVWVTFWTLGGLAAWSAVLWQLLGVEQVFITGGALVREAGVGPFRRRRIYPLASVQNFRLASTIANARNKKGGGGAVAFDVAGATRRFGIGMSDEEAKMSLAAIRRYLPKGGAGAAKDATIPPEA